MPTTRAKPKDKKGPKPEIVALNGLSLDIAAGEVFGLLGPNGAGKSTTFRMMCGLIAPTSGTARVMGIDLKKSAS